MDVSTLIAQLSEFHGDAEVRVYNSSSDLFEAASLIVIDGENEVVIADLN